MKKYCECFNAGIDCSEICKCAECKNYEESEERRAILANCEIPASPSAAQFNKKAETPNGAKQKFLDISPKIVKEKPTEMKADNPQHNMSFDMTLGLAGKRTLIKGSMHANLIENKSVDEHLKEPDTKKKKTVISYGILAYILNKLQIQLIN